MIEDEMTPQDVLLAAADIIQQRGLKKCNLGQVDGPVCSIGAINEVLTGCPQVFGHTAEGYIEAQRMLRNYIVDQKLSANSEWGSNPVIVGWNNAKATRANDVIAALHGAARGTK